MARWIKRLAIVLAAIVVVAVLTLWLLLRGSLPTLDGELALPGLSAPVSIQRDALGVATIDAASETDAMRALGYLHAQERYFEMDLMRRTAAGELAELFGPIAVETDKRHRIHRFRARVEQKLDAILVDKRPVAQAYVEGVNAGLRDLKVRPWPYLLLRTQPEPWQLSDTPLVGYAMYFDLQDGDNKRELALWKLKPHVPAALFALLTQEGSSWDAPLMGEPRGDAVLPTAEQLDLRKLPAPDLSGTKSLPAPRELGSNNFAVAGALTRDGRAIVADDMHLTLRAPNIWFRARLRYPDARAPGGRIDIGGFTLSGIPAVIVGSNGHVAWAFTNSYGDWTDWARMPLCVPFSSCAGNVEYSEQIAVAGADPVAFPVRETSWGPVLHTGSDGSTLSLRWVAHAPEGLRLSMADLGRARDLQDAFAIAGRSSIPAQNLVLADRSGRIGWRLLGAIPQRDPGCDRLLPTELSPSGAKRPASADTADGSVGTCTPWSLDYQHTPVVIDPPSHRLWTANNRVADGEALARIGDGGYVLGARGRQIRDDLFAKQQFTERDLLAIQLDDRTVFMQRWWQLLRDQAQRSKTPALRELADAAPTWTPRASIDAVSYRLVRTWRLAVHARIGDGLTAPARAALGDNFAMPDLPQLEGVAWPLVTQRPAHLLPRGFESWDALFEDAARQVRDELKEKGPLARRTWGEQNTSRICHPLAGALPAFAKQMLCMPFEPLPGDVAMPRVQHPDMGASERMVVSPGHEADGIIHMPGGQSGHPLSPFWGAGHDDWVQGRPTPFLPGKTEHTLRISPARK
ncbi:MAG TPA: penicillin acylase family protein [Lysobacter sp.]